MIPVRLLREWLIRLTFLYLTAPVAIFIAGWVWWPFAVILGICFVAASWSLTRESADDGRRQQSDDHATIHWFRLAVICLPGLLLTLLAGAGGWGIQAGDWLKHNAVLKDLIERPWPVVYQTEQDPVGLIYFLAYYLPAALVGKLCGWTAANHALFLTSLLGMALVGMWVALLTRGAAWSGLVFALFSGMDLVGALAVHLHGGSPIPHRERIQWWNGSLQYSSTPALLFWVPNHALVGWLA